MNWLKLGIISGFILFLGGCDVEQYVNVPVSYTPKLVFNPGTTSILLINQFEINKTKINNDKKLGVIKAGAFTAIKYAEAQLKELPNVKVTSLVDSAAFALNTDSIKFLASKYHVNYVLALKNFNADIVLGTIEGSQAYYNTNVEVNFVLYGVEGNTILAKKLNGKTSDPQVGGEFPGLLGSIIIHPTVRGSKSSINISAQNATQYALQDYLPYSIAHNRPLYNDKIFQPAIKEILAGNFEKADTLLTPFLKNSNALIVCKAAYNLAVVYEAEGDVVLAINLAQQSMDKYRNEYAMVILQDLQTE
jgi:hypothetical protein